MKQHKQVSSVVDENKLVVVHEVSGWLDVLEDSFLECIDARVQFLTKTLQVSSHHYIYVV